MIDEWFAEPLDEEELEKARLLVSELVTNAVRHGKGQITLQADLDENRLLIEVIDEGGGLERAIRERDFTGVGGWGLRLVDSQSSRWGAHEGTTHVWFELERAGPRLGAEENPLELPLPIHRGIEAAPQGAGRPAVSAEWNTRSGRASGPPASGGANDWRAGFAVTGVVPVWGQVRV